MTIQSSHVHGIVKRMRDNEKLYTGTSNSYMEESTDALVAAIQKRLPEDTEQRYCFVATDLRCGADKIVAYDHNLVFYLQI